MTTLLQTVFRQNLMAPMWKRQASPVSEAAFCSSWSLCRCCACVIPKRIMVSHHTQTKMRSGSLKLTESSCFSWGLRSAEKGDDDDDDDGDGGLTAGNGASWSILVVGGWDMLGPSSPSRNEFTGISSCTDANGRNMQKCCACRSSLEHFYVAHLCDWNSKSNAVVNQPINSQY